HWLRKSGRRPLRRRCPRVERLESRMVLTGDPPVAYDDTFAVTEDEPRTIHFAEILANDFDAENDYLNAVILSEPLHGALTYNSDGTLTYQPDPNYHGADWFTYEANDGPGVSSPATVTLLIEAVNDAPVAGDDAFATEEDTELDFWSWELLANDADVDEDTLAIALVDGPANGSLTEVSGLLSYHPDENFFGTDSFTYRATDGLRESNLVTVWLTVNPVNDAPAASGFEYILEDNTALTIATPGALWNASDIEGDNLVALLVAGPTYGTLQLDSSGAFTYTPDLDFWGSDQFTFVASDGQANSAPATIVLTVVRVDNPPEGSDDYFSLIEDETLDISAPGVLENDDNPDGQTLAAQLVTGPANGTLSLSSSGAFTYEPHENFTGNDSFTYIATNGASSSSPATVYLTISPANDPATTQDDTYSVDEDSTLHVAGIGLLANDVDLDGDVLNVSLLAGPSHGTLSLAADGTFTYLPNPNFSGQDAFTYVASDGIATSAAAVVTISVAPINDAPVGQADAYEIAEDGTLVVSAAGVLANDSDVEGTALEALLLASPGHGTVTLLVDGSFVYVPTAGYSGTDSFSYRASDGADQSAEVVVSIFVAFVNDAPVAINDAYAVDEDATLVVMAPGLLGNDSDEEGSPLSVTIVSGPEHGTLELQSDGSFVYVPTANWHGTDEFTYRTFDGFDQSEVATVVISVHAVNDAPAAAADEFSVGVNRPLVIESAELLQNDLDQEGDALTIELVGQASHGQVTLLANGSYSYIPTANFHGTDSFTYRLGDGTSFSNAVTVTISVISIGDPPVISEFSVETIGGWIWFEGLVTDDDDPTGLLVQFGGCLGSFVATVESSDRFSLMKEYVVGTHGEFTAYVVDQHGNRSATITRQIS
ncbi:MAG: Ig-like domain-containing protein, partial [Pirellulaceae bacterium]|nr:Ig-like domain-containing protein [Pirellulaceae bacterium]